MLYCSPTMKIKNEKSNNTSYFTLAVFLSSQQLYEEDIVSFSFTDKNLGLLKGK
jgi:hypothetical protein